MSADSPRRRLNSRCVPAVVPPQVVSDRSILDSAIGFINDVTLSHQPHSDPKDVITWARFESMADISDPRFGEDWELEGNVAPPLLLILGYGLGVQVWAIPANGEAVEVLSWRHGSVSALRVLPTPAVCNEDVGRRADELTDAYAEKRPLMALCDGGGFSSKLGGSGGGGGSQPQFCAVNFVSLKTGTQVRTIKFKNPVLEILANRTSVVITFHERIAVFDARTLDDRLSITSCYPSPGINPNPVALGSRWLAYAEHKLLHSKRSGGGCDGEGVSSYTATVLNAAKSFGKGLRELGEQVAAGLTGTSTGGGSGSNSKSSSFDSNSSGDMRQPGIVTIMDIKHPIKDVSPTTGAPISTNGSDPFVAHFLAHSEALVAMEFDNSGMLLVTADKRGHDFHVFRIQPHPVGSSLAAVQHLYVLHRGDTTAKVQNIAYSLDSRWIAVSTLRGTTHVFPITPYGGPMGVRTHTSLHVVNKLSRFHRSAGLSADGRSSSPIPHSESTIFSQSLMAYHNPTLPPYTRPAVVLPLAQLRQPFVLGSPPGSAASLSKSSGSASTGSACSQRQRLSSLSDDNGKPLSVCAIFAKSRAWLLDPPNAAREAPHRMQRKAVDSLFVMAGHGALIQYDLDTRLASNVAKEKICDETPIELEVEAKAQWNLGRNDASQEIMPPLFSDNWLIKDRNSCMLTDSTRQFDEADDRADSWLSQVEIITHAGPHRRLWMGPQFVFKTYNTPSGSNLSHIEAEAIEIGVSSATNAAGARAERSSPLNMPLSAAGRSSVPVLIESGSYSSIEQSPKLMDRFRHEHLDSDFAVAHGDSRLKEDLADAMRESPSVAKNPTTTTTTEFLLNDAASENAPFYDALAEHDDDNMASSHVRRSAAAAALAHALPNIYSYAAYSSQETSTSIWNSAPRPTSIEKVVNPLGTVTTIMAGMSSEVSTDILDEVVSQLAAEETVIHENCDESLFRPVVAIFCDEKTRMQGEEARKQQQELCKPPEVIGNKFIVPVIDKERDDELCKKEKQKSGLARARGRMAASVAPKAEDPVTGEDQRRFAELAQLSKKRPVLKDLKESEATVIFKEENKKENTKEEEKIKNESEVKPKEEVTISDTTQEINTLTIKADQKIAKKLESKSRNRKSEEKPESEKASKAPEIKGKLSDGKQRKQGARDTTKIAKEIPKSEERAEKKQPEKSGTLNNAEKKDESDDLKEITKHTERAVQEELSEENSKKELNNKNDDKNRRSSSRREEMNVGSMKQIQGRVLETENQERQSEELDESNKKKLSTNDVFDDAKESSISTKHGVKGNEELEDLQISKIQTKENPDEKEQEEVISKDFDKIKDSGEEEKFSVGQEVNPIEIKRTSSSLPPEKPIKQTADNGKQSGSRKSMKTKSMEKNTLKTEKYHEAVSTKKTPSPDDKNLEGKATGSEKLLQESSDSKIRKDFETPPSESLLENSNKIKEAKTDESITKDEIDNPKEPKDNRESKTRVIEQKEPLEFLTENTKPTTKKKKQKSNKSASNSESDEVVEVVRTTKQITGKDKKICDTIAKKPKPVKEEKSSTSSTEDTFADFTDSLLESKQTMEQPSYISYSEIIDKEVEIRDETETSLGIQRTRNSEDSSTSTESNTPESVRELKDSLKTKIEKPEQKEKSNNDSKVIKNQPEDLIRREDKMEAPESGIQMVTNKTKSLKNDLKSNNSATKESVSSKTKSDEEVERHEKTKETKDKLKSAEKQDRESHEFKSQTDPNNEIYEIPTKTPSETVQTVDSGKESTEDGKKHSGSKGAVKKQIRKRDHVMRENALEVSNNKTTTETAKIEKPTEDVKKLIKADDAVKEQKIKSKEFTDDNTMANNMKDECKANIAPSAKPAEYLNETKRPKKSKSENKRIEVAITEQPKRSKPEELHGEIPTVPAKDAKKTKKSRNSVEKPSSGASSNEDGVDQTQKQVEENLLLFEKCSPEQSSEKTIAKMPEIAKPLSAWQTLSGAEMINQQLIGVLPATAEKERTTVQPVKGKNKHSSCDQRPAFQTVDETKICTSKSNKKCRKPTIGTNFDEFPSLKPLEPLPPLSPLAIFEPLQTEIPKTSSTICTTRAGGENDPNESPVSLITFESPQLENTALPEPRISPPPRGFTEQNLIFALCGSLHYENESQNSRSSTSTTSSLKSTVNYKSLIEHINDEQYLSLEQCQEEKLRATQEEKSSSGSNTSSVSSEEISKALAMENKKMSKKQQKHKKLELDLLKQKGKQQLKERAIDADDDDADDDEDDDEDGDDEELQPLISLSESKLDTDSGNNQPIFTFPAVIRGFPQSSMNIYNSRKEGGGGGGGGATTTDSEGPMAATTTSEDYNVAYHAYRSGSSLNNSSIGTKLKTKKLEHKINLIAAIEAATSSSTSSAEEESGVEGGGCASANSGGGSGLTATDNAIINLSTSNIATATLSNIQYPPAAAQQSASKKKTKRRKR